MSRSKLLTFVVFCLANLVLLSSIELHAAEPGKRWSVQKANEWHAKQPWRIGCNFTPSTAINQLEMWQKETFDPKTIDRELGWAEGIGMSVIRVYLHDLAYQADPQGFKDRMNQFLEIAHKHHIVVLFVFFDDCWNADAKTGKQPAPKPGIHNSGWVQSPVSAVREQEKEFPRLEKYVTDVLTTFKDDKRVILWDLYNEPGNTQHLNKSLPLLQSVFEWARKVNPSQPLTAGIWQFGTPEYKDLNEFQTSNSDVITYHIYTPVKDSEEKTKLMKKFGRPVICTEYMNRPTSTFQSHLPMLKRENIWAINWGLVDGKTQTKFPWGSKLNAPEPKPWFHEVFHPDGKPYDSKETDLMKQLTKPQS